MLKLKSSYILVYNFRTDTSYTPVVKRKRALAVLPAKALGNPHKN